MASSLHNILEFKIGTTDDLPFIYESFKNNFPTEERKSFKHLEGLINSGVYKLFFITNKKNKDLVGFAFIFTIEKEKMLWLDFISITDNYKNKGYGSILFNKIIEFFGCNNYGILLEIEIPDELEENTVRRLKFYNRLGCINTNQKYYLPTPTSKLQMVLMYKPISEDKIIPKDKLKNVIISVNKNIHKDILHANETLNSFIDEISDVNL